MLRFENFLPDLEILKPPEEPGPKPGSLFSASALPADFPVGRATHLITVSLRRKKPAKSIDWPRQFTSSAEMTGGDDKWIRSIKDNPAGKVVADPEGNRWEWDRGDQDETSRLLNRLHNEELSIEQTDIVPNPVRHRGRGRNARITMSREPQSPRRKNPAAATPAAVSTPMTTRASRAAEAPPSMLSSAALWLWRLANTALLAAGVWLLWRQTVEIASLNGALHELVDYLSVIAERIG